VFKKQWQVTSSEWRGKAYSVFLLLLLVTSHSPLAIALDDPTQPPDYLTVAPQVASLAKESAPQRQWILSSTLVSSTRRLAVINGQVVKKGDMLDDAQVVDITSLTVHMKNTEGSFSLSMLPAAIKTLHSKDLTKAGSAP